MKLEIDLTEVYSWEDTNVAEIIREEIKDEIRLAVKREVKKKDSEIAKAIQLYANKQAQQLKKQMEESIAGVVG